MHISTILAVVLVEFVKISYGNHIETAMARSRGFGGGGGIRGVGGFQGFGGGIPGRATIPGMPMPGDPSFGRMFGGGGGAIGGLPRRQRGGLQGDLFGGSGSFPGGFSDGALVGGRDGLPMFGGSGQSDPRGAADGRFDGSIGADLSTLFGQGLVPPAIGLGGTFGTTDGAFMDPMSGQPVQLVSTGVADQFRQARIGNGGGQTQSSSSLDPFAAFLGSGSTSGFSATGIAGPGDGLFMGNDREPLMIQPEIDPEGAIDIIRLSRILRQRRGNGRSFGSDPRTQFPAQMTRQPVQFISTDTFNTNRGTQSQRMVAQGLGLGGIFGAVPDAQFIDPTSGAPVQLAPTGVINTLRDARAGGFAGFGGQGGGVSTFPGAGMGGNIFQQQGIGGFPQGGAGGAGSFTPVRIPADRSRGPTLTRAGITEQLGPGTTLADLGLGGGFGASAGSFGQSGAGQQGFESFGQQGLGTRTGGQGGSQIFSGQSFQIPSGTQGFQQSAASLGPQAPGGFDAAFAGFGAQNPFGGGQPQTGAGFQGQLGAGTAASFGQQAEQPSGQQFGGLTFTQLGGSQSSQGGASSSIFPTDFSQFQDLPGGAGGQFQSSFDAPFQGSGASSSGFGAFGDQAGTSLPGVSLTASNPGTSFDQSFRAEPREPTFEFQIDSVNGNTSLSVFSYPSTQQDVPSQSIFQSRQNDSSSRFPTRPSIAEEEYVFTPGSPIGPVLPGFQSHGSLRRPADAEAGTSSSRLTSQIMIQDDRSSLFTDSTRGTLSQEIDSGLPVGPSKPLSGNPLVNSEVESRDFSASNSFREHAVFSSASSNTGGGEGVMFSVSATDPFSDFVSSNISPTKLNTGLGQFSQSSPQGSDLTGFTGLSQSGANPFSQGPTSGGQFGGTSSGGSASTFSGQGVRPKVNSGGSIIPNINSDSLPEVYDHLIGSSLSNSTITFPYESQSGQRGDQVDENQPQSLDYILFDSGRTMDIISVRLSELKTAYSD